MIALLFLLAAGVKAPSPAAEPAAPAPVQIEISVDKPTAPTGPEPNLEFSKSQNAIDAEKPTTECVKNAANPSC